VNKDPKKSKYSDTLHRFCKKEHDWGWKKFMELSKVLDGFTVADTLVIKAQVQVIHEKPGEAVSVPGTPVQARASQGVPHKRRRDLPQVSGGAPGPARQVPGGLGPMG
jgi:hypothetical protein